MFAFLRDLNDEQLYCLLANEEIRMSALALDQINQERRMTFLNKLDPGRKNKIILEIGNLAEIPLEAIINMARELEEKVSFIPGLKNSLEEEEKVLPPFLVKCLKMKQSNIWIS